MAATAVEGVNTVSCPVCEETVLIQEVDVIDPDEDDDEDEDEDDEDEDDEDEDDE